METPNAIRVKIGTLPAKWARLVKRRPRRGLVPAIRRAPEVGELFYVMDTFDTPVLLRCDLIKPDLGPLYYAERA